MGFLHLLIVNHDAVTPDEDTSINELYRGSPVIVTMDAKNIDPDHMIVEKESGNTFKIQEFPFEGEFTSGGNRITYPCNFKAEGTAR